ncbi:aspartoacylase [Alteromonas sp. C1M14]|uniref:aspartoacylase n=1 Tax=Alteromonas sp. C1M14 TaxID=2841567 RepID=UPI001C0A582F|nr:aspartoacylase [Alteromonas sp. C1M14]MBU2979404.1 aspartoacylase [Alteromonas sp. C1M14]
MLNSIVLTGGAHGNETSGIELIRQWQLSGMPARFNNLNVRCGLANPNAIDANVRFLEEDLNRQFTVERLASDNLAAEAVLAKQLNELYGPKGPDSATDFFIDVHNTTSEMGATLIILEHDAFNIALARFVKNAMPEANILIEDEKTFASHGYLCTLGKKGVMIEVGGQPQGVLREDVYLLTQKMAEAILDFCLAWNEKQDLSTLPPCEAFRLGREISFPLDDHGQRKAMIHHQLQDKDFIALEQGAPAFTGFDGTIYLWEEDTTYPHFINEAAYHKLDVAFATSQRITL